MFPAPPVPSFPPGQSAVTMESLRYEDVTQQGHIIPLAIPPVLSGLWRATIVPHKGARNALAQGIIPILTRLTIVSLDQPIRPDADVESTAGFVVAHDRDASGEVSKLYMNVWANVRGVAGRIRPGATMGTELAPCGQLFAEHTFTRLLAPPDQRKVTRLANVDGYPEIPEMHHPALAPTTAGEHPPGGRWLDELAPDSADYCFSLDQTDSNQHVNSLVYINLFMEAVNRRLAAAGAPLKVRTRAVDIAYRKPCFAGDRVRAHVRRFEHPDGSGAAGYIAGNDGKPRCYVRIHTA